MPDIIEDTSATKAFNFKNIPGILHKQWKMLASMKEVSMEELGLIAIKKYIDEEVRKLNATIGE